MIWQIQDSREIYPNRGQSLYVGLTVYEHGRFSATTHVGTIYFLDYSNGKILGSSFTK